MNLTVLIAGRRAGEVVQHNDGRLTFAYHEDWMGAAHATPLSLSMPLAQRSHGDDAVRAFIWGLLPDNERVLDRWARSYQVSARNPFSLLWHVGEDCAGAAQFVRPDRVDALLAAEGGVNWVKPVEIAERLRRLRRDPAAWHADTGGQFSLAGAQAKTALFLDRENGRWGDPWGVEATTHILKPAITGFDDHDLNEHLCLASARALGLSAAVSQVMSFDDERAIVIERYDRLKTDPERRVHQEDLCQAMGLPPTAKYQNEGGPTPERIVALLRGVIDLPRQASNDVARFVDMLAFNWIIGGTDGHAKNYSVLLEGEQVRLAPLYDVASALPYDDLYTPKLRMAMRIGGEYRLTAISGRHWRRFAEGIELDPAAVTARIDDLAARAPEAFEKAAQEESVRGLDSDLPARLVDRIGGRARQCREALAG